MVNINFFSVKKNGMNVLHLSSVYGFCFTVPKQIKQKLKVSY
jgi:cystathionine beta-lyase/cystathionine gamma-synthase